MIREDIIPIISANKPLTFLSVNILLTLNSISCVRYVGWGHLSYFYNWTNYEPSAQSKYIKMFPIFIKNRQINIGMWEHSQVLRLDNLAKYPFLFEIELLLHVHSLCAPHAKMCVSTPALEEYCFKPSNKWEYYRSKLFQTFLL